MWTDRKKKEHSRDKEMIELVIFDFDGIVVDSKRVYYDIINKYLNPMGFDKNRVDKIIDIGLNLSETLKKFVPSSVTRWALRKKIMVDVIRDVHKVRKCNDIEHIKDIRVKKILVSNSLSEFVDPIMKRLKIRKFFDRVYCADDFDDKEKFIRMYLKVHGIRPNECAYVGDRVADVKISKKLKCHGIIVSGKCAWDSKQEIVKAKPEFIIPSIKFLNRIISGYKH